MLSRSMVFVLVLAACQPSPQAPVTVMALLYGDNNKLGPRQTTLDTIGSITNLTGSVVEFAGGAQIVLDPSDPLQMNLGALSDDQLSDALLRDRGSAVRANLVDKGGVLWPADFHSWNMVTSYWNFEQAFTYFQLVYDGESTKQLEGAKVFYWGSYKNLSISDPTKQETLDNAFYYPPVHAFVLAPFQDLQKVPLAMNLGVIGHEYSHRVFAQKAYGNQALPQVLGLWEGLPLNLVKSIDEGFADFHGYGVTCRAKDGPGCSTRYLAQSFDEETAEGKKLVDNRDFSRTANGENCLTVELRTALNNLSSNDFLNQGKQYEIGTLFAAALYQAGNKGGGLQGIEIVEKALVRAYDDETNGTPGFRQLFDSNLATSEKITLEAVSDVILSHITDPQLKKLACNELWDRLQLDLPNTQVTHCPNTSLKGNSCPVLPPP